MMPFEKVKILYFFNIVGNDLKLHKKKYFQKYQRFLK